ncbi:hypothetical protein ABZ484_11035 [Streptomyces sp. NPDC006393]|uniref:VOC family protein n=1 Tax=Streptomyces sp. NPDC006393 TaxID=3156763 RepID=UPI0033E6D0C3
MSLAARQLALAMLDRQLLLGRRRLDVAEAVRRVWIQVFRSPEHAGSTLLNLVVDDLDGALSELAGRGIRVGEIQPGAQRVRFAAVHDPDGNRVTLIENPVT